MDSIAHHPTEDTYMTVSELAEIVGLAPYTVYEMVKRGDAPRARRFGRQIRFARTDVDAWLDAA